MGTRGLSDKPKGIEMTKEDVIAHAQAIVARLMTDEDPDPIATDMCEHLGAVPVELFQAYLQVIVGGKADELPPSDAVQRTEGYKLRVQALNIVLAKREKFNRAIGAYHDWRNKGQATQP
jgi:hypothetical protein